MAATRPTFALLQPDHSSDFEKPGDLDFLYQFDSRRTTTCPISEQR